MMSIEYIQSMADEATTRAKRGKVQPLVLNADSTEEQIRSIPNLGDYVHPSWQLEEDLFVDSSGFGAPGEPALTFEQFVEKVQSQEGVRAYGIRQVGQFQVYIGVYRKSGF